ncbi:MAG: EAL domain-containing protein, partial [Myxococcales bacterium]|nr:EAL domain-containing protein [Myxococcales bacterium]
HEIYDSSMRIEARTLLALEMSLRRAIDENQLRLHYQPIRWIDTRTILGFEALVRWQHPERGQISPAEFIPVAEDTGLIIPMGRWAIREAVRQLHGWQEEFARSDLAVSVNLSMRQIGDPLLLETIDTALAETGLEARCLKLELTESVMMDGAAEVSSVLQEIRSRGVEIWIDDFGTGFSSLAYLQRFPVDGLKIDRSFVEQLDGSERSAVMVKTILAMAQNLDLAVVAEGIEEEVQARQLQELGCMRCQGWLLGRPMNDERVRELDF